MHETNEFELFEKFKACFTLLYSLGNWQNTFRIWLIVYLYGSFINTNYNCI